MYSVPVDKCRLQICLLLTDYALLLNYNGESAVLGIDATLHEPSPVAGRLGLHDKQQPFRCIHGAASPGLIKFKQFRRKEGPTHS